MSKHCWFYLYKGDVQSLYICTEHANLQQQLLSSIAIVMQNRKVTKRKRFCTTFKTIKTIYFTAGSISIKVMSKTFKYVPNDRIFSIKHCLWLLSSYRLEQSHQIKEKRIAQHSTHQNNAP